MSDIDQVREEVLAVIESLYPKSLKSGEVTLRHVMDRLGISEGAAKDVLLKEVKAGRLIEIPEGRLSDNGHKIRAWRKIEPPEVE